MVGKLAPYVVVGLIQKTLILILARVLFGVPMAGGWLSLAIGVMLFIIVSLALGFLISTDARTQIPAMQLSFFYMFPSILLSGARKSDVSGKSVSVLVDLVVRGVFHKNY